MQLSRTSNGLTNPMTASGDGSACTCLDLRSHTCLQTEIFHRTADL